MSTIAGNDGRPLVLGHRGASAHAPENTLAAFRLAYEHGADGVELDAKLSADGQIVVMHDSTVMRTTGAAGRVQDLSLAQLKSLDAGAGEPVPTLEEVLLEFRQPVRPFLIDIELTNYTTPTDGLPERVAQLAQRLGMLEQVLFTSFFPCNLHRVQRSLPDARCGLLAWAGWMGLLSRGLLARRYAPELALPYFTDLSAGYIARAHRRGQRVFSWTVNQAADMLRLSDWGVDGIITDDPQLTLHVLRKKETPDEPGTPIAGSTDHLDAAAERDSGSGQL